MLADRRHLSDSSGPPVPDLHLPVQQDGRYFTDAAVLLEHAFQSVGVALYIHVLERRVLSAKFLTGGLGVWSARFSINDDAIAHELILTQRFEAVPQYLQLSRSAPGGADLRILSTIFGMYIWW